MGTSRPTATGPHHGTQAWGAAVDTATGRGGGTRRGVATGPHHGEGRARVLRKRADRGVRSMAFRLIESRSEKVRRVFVLKNFRETVIMGSSTQLVMLSTKLLAILVPLLTGLCFAGLCVFGLQVLEKGAISYGRGYSRKTSVGFEDLFLFIPPGRIAEIAWLCAAIAAFLSFLVLGGFRGSLLVILVRLAVSCGLGSLMLLAPSKLLTVMRQRRRDKINLQLVDALSDMSNAMRSGFSILQAVEHIAENGVHPISEEFATVLHQTRVGVPFEEALHNLDSRIGSEDLSLVVLSIETARSTGGNLAEIFETISKTIRARLRIQERIKTLTAQGRLQGIILSMMPIAIGFALHVVNPGMLHPFLTSPVGIGTLVAVVVLLICGALTIRKIVNIDP